MCEGGLLASTGVEPYRSPPADRRPPSGLNAIGRITDLPWNNRYWTLLSERFGKLLFVYRVFYRLFIFEVKKAPLLSKGSICNKVKYNWANFCINSRICGQFVATIRFGSLSIRYVSHPAMLHSLSYRTRYLAAATFLCPLTTILLSFVCSCFSTHRYPLQ